MKYWILFLLVASFTLVVSCQSADPAVRKMEELCLSESKKIAGMSEGLIEYCACAAPKILAKAKDDQVLMARFDAGEFTHINESQDTAFMADLAKCVNGDKLIFNPPTMEFLLPERAENSIRVTIIDQMTDDFKATHNVDQYCDCYLNAIKTKLTFEEFHARDLEEMPKYKTLLNDCAKESAL